MSHRMWANGSLVLGTSCIPSRQRERDVADARHAVPARRRHHDAAATERGAQLTRPSMLAIGTTLRQPQHIE